MNDITGLLKQYKIPGAALAIVTPDSLLYSGGLGYADIASEHSVDENTLFRTGSITKSFVALGILKLVEQGKLDLQTPVKQILPEVEIENPWETSHPLRIVHLLEHTSGLNDTPFNDFYLNGDPGIPLKEGMKVSEHYLVLRWKPGVYRSYSSAGYMLAGIILEKITGERFEDFLQREVLVPLEMNRSAFRLTPQIQPLLATGYQNNYRPSQYWHSYSRPAGSMISCASDMEKFLRMMLNNGSIENRDFLKESSIHRMETSRTDPAAEAGLESTSGMGVGVGYYKGSRWYTHYGSIMGFSGAYGYSRDIGMGCVLLTNRWDVDFETGMTRVWNTLRDYLISRNEFQPKPPVRKEVSKEILSNYAGYYRWCNPPQQLSAWIDLILNYHVIEMQGDTLYHKDVFFGSWKPFIPVTDSTFRSRNENIPTKAFVNTSDNHTVFIDRGSYYLQTVWLLPWVHGISFFLAWLILLFFIPYAMVWIPYYGYVRFIKKKPAEFDLMVRLLPFLAIVIILLAFIFVGIQVEESIALLGQKTPANIFFYIATWIFAVLSFGSLIFSVNYFRQPGYLLPRATMLLVSLSCVGMTLYWAYWGMIGLKLWAY